MDQDLLNTLIRRFDKLAADRRVFDTHWQEVAELVLPTRDFTFKPSVGYKRNQKIFDGTAPWANEQFASGLHGYLTSPDIKWFTLATEDEDLMLVDEVRLWLEDCEMKMYSVFNASEYRFNPACNEVYLDIGAFGNGCLYIGEKPNSITFQARPLGECYPAENDDGIIDTMFRKFDFTARQAVKAFPKARSIRAIDQALVNAKDTEKKFTFLHAACPNEEYNPAKITYGPNKKWSSCYIHIDSKMEVANKGFNEFPFMFPRWVRVAGETYARGPGMTLLPDIRMVNMIMQTVIKSAQKVVDPPLQVPDDSFMGTIRMTPSALNYYRAGTQDRIEPILTKGDPKLGVDLIQMVQKKIERGFHVDQLEMPEDKNEGSRVAVGWVMQRRDEKMRLLAPTLSRMNSEFVGPVVNRVFNIMMRAGAFLPPPAALSGARLVPRYVSPVAKAQRAQEAQALMQLFQLVAPLTQVNPGAMSIVKPGETIRWASDIFGVPSRLLMTRQEEEAKKQADAKQAQMTQLQQTIVDGAGAAKDAGAANKNFAQADQARQANGPTGTGQATPQ